MAIIGKAVNLVRFYYVQRVQGFEPPAEPHLDPDTRNALTEHLENSDLFMEFGCGGSTIEAAGFGVPTISIDSDPYYAKTVRNSLPANHQTKIIDADIGITRQWGRPLINVSTPGRRRRWLQYVDRPIEEARQRNMVPDLVMVDGRFRMACALAAAAYAAELKQSTTIFIDDYADVEMDTYRGANPFQGVTKYLGLPTLVGRSAWFTVSPENPPVQPITRAAVTEAAADPR